MLGAPNIYRLNALPSWSCFLPFYVSEAEEHALRFHINYGNMLEEFYHQVHFTIPEICLFLVHESMATMLLYDPHEYFCFNEEELLSDCCSEWNSSFLCLWALSWGKKGINFGVHMEQTLSMMLILTFQYTPELVKKWKQEGVLKSAPLVYLKIWRKLGSMPHSAKQSQNVASIPLSPFVAVLWIIVLIPIDWWEE